MITGPFRWTRNNSLRPDTDYWYTEGDNDVNTYNPNLGDRFYYAIIPFVNERTLSFSSVNSLDNTFEIFSYAAQARSFPIGASSDVSTFKGYNLKTSLSFNRTHYSHSKQFRSNIVDEWNYWEKVIVDADLPSIK